MLETAYIQSPFGNLEIKGNDDGIQSILFVDGDHIKLSQQIPTTLKKCVLQLNEYFLGSRKEFDLKLNPQGTDFQKQVWFQLQNIAFGKTITYAQQSKNLGNAKAIRAVAAANGKNPISIILPCHRVLGSNGTLTGYSGGIWRKKWLLQHEGAIKQQTLF